MIVCCCRGVSDRQVRTSVAGGAASAGAVARACGAGAGCGGCIPTVRALIEEARNDESGFGALLSAQRDGGQVIRLAVASRRK